jgi:alkylated DNA repair dioxygenase AlkB
MKIPVPRRRFHTVSELDFQTALEQCVDWRPSWDTATRADALLAELSPFLDQRPVRIFNQLKQQPRLTAYFNSDGHIYRYSGTSYIPLPFSKSPLLEDLLHRVNTGWDEPFEFDSCFVNLYRDGNDSIGAHSDNESAFHKDRILSLSYGATRLFRLRYQKVNYQDVALSSGDAILMKGPCQDLFTHEVPKFPACNQWRLNLTFRQSR